MSELYSTSDIWLGAYLLSETDAQLDDVCISRNGRDSIFFTFSGKNLSKTAKDYAQKMASANVVELRNNINFLRDIIFQSKKN